MSENINTPPSAEAPQLIDPMELAFANDVLYAGLSQKYDSIVSTMAVFEDLQDSGAAIARAHNWDKQVEYRENLRHASERRREFLEEQWRRVRGDTERFPRLVEVRDLQTKAENAVDPEEHARLVQEFRDMRDAYVDEFDEL